RSAGPGRLWSRRDPVTLRARSAHARSVGSGSAGEQLEAVVPCAASAADLDPHDADRLELARALDAADVERVGPTEVCQQIADGALCLVVVSGDQHRLDPLAEA